MRITSRDEAFAQLEKFTQSVGDKTLFLEAQIPSGGHAEVVFSKRAISLSLETGTYKKSTTLDMRSHAIVQNEEVMPETYLHEFHTEITKLLSSRHLRWQETWDV